MNLLDAVVTKVLDAPKYFRMENVEWWQVEIEYNCYGVVSTMTYSRPTYEEIKLVKEGYEFLC